MFSNLIGNEEVKNSLQRLLENGRLPGSLLFTGEEGVGKKLFALELAKILNCKTRRGVEACDECSSCKRISHSTFPPFNNDDDDKTRLIWSEHADVAMVRPYKQIIRVGPDTRTGTRSQLPPVRRCGPPFHHRRRRLHERPGRQRFVEDAGRA